MAAGGPTTYTLSQNLQANATGGTTFAVEAPGTTVGRAHHDLPAITVQQAAPEPPTVAPTTVASPPTTRCPAEAPPCSAAHAGR